MLIHRSNLLLHRLIFAASLPIITNFSFTNPQMDLIPDQHQFASSPVVVVEKPFQPKWSNSLGIRRKISRPTGANQQQQRNKMKEGGGESSSSQSPLKHHQIDIDEWTTNSRDQQHQRGGGEHKIVHLTSRPTQLYYFQQDGPELSGDTVELGAGQVCRVKVPSSEIFYIAYEDGADTRPSVDLFFHCSQYWAWCCGVDCCQIDPSLMVVGLCVCILIFAFSVHLCLRSRFSQRFCLNKLFRRRKRVIARANAQRRKRSGSSSQGGGEQRRIRINSLKEAAGGGKGHKKLAKAITRDVVGMNSGGNKTKEIPEIVITEPSSCYEPSYNASEVDDEEEDEAYEEDEEE